MTGVLDLRLIRDDPDLVKRAVEAKGIDLDVDALLALDAEVRRLKGSSEAAQAEKKRLSKEFGRADEETRARLREEIARIDAGLQKDKDDLAAKQAELDELMLLTPGIPWEGAPVGADESDNVVIKKVGEPPVFDFEPLDHITLLEQRGWAEFARARNVAGERAYALVGDAVLLERALLSYALDVLVTRDFTPISVPSLVREMALVGTGMFPKGREETYELPADNLFLAGTAEVALVGLHAGEILDKARLPIKYAGISPCFRREIGSASRDVRGLVRVHQFEKVEQFILCEADDAESERWHATLLDCAESLLQALGLAYEVVECATGDMGIGKFRMNDINTWFPSLHTFRETHSCSTLHDWQARRADLRYRDSDGTVKHVHTLNNTAIATPRLVAALVENHQNADGTVTVPEPLRPYLGGRAVL
ncbi:serine--tRNA ligase [Nocardioides bigeumensis]|uniref:Serine--tRNA ligase n=1 Tax=Nocardioides bigeumensis TaxID=433657 RepID=A0ABP5JCH0_9ACTN